MEGGFGHGLRVVVRQAPPSLFICQVCIIRYTDSCFGNKRAEKHNPEDLVNDNVMKNNQILSFDCQVGSFLNYFYIIFGPQKWPILGDFGPF